MELFFRWFFGLGVFALGLGWLLIYFFLEIVRIHIKAKAGERGDHAEGRRGFVVYSLTSQSHLSATKSSH